MASSPGPGSPGRARGPRLGVALALAALVAWSFWDRWTLLSSTPFPVGVDGYFYPIQLRSLLETGHLAYPASPLAFWLMAPLAALTDPITGAKLGAALFGAAIALPAYGVGARLGRGRGAGLVAAALATSSAGSAYLTIEFVKNGIGLTVALAALWAVLAALDRPTTARILGAAAGVLAAALAHKMAAGIVLAIAVPAALGAAAGRGALRGRRLLYVLGGLAGVAAILLAIGLAAPRRFLSPADAALIERLWSSEARWTAPALIGARTTLTLGHEALIGLGLGCLAAIALGRRGRRGIAAAARAVAGRDRVDEMPHGPAGETVAAWAIAALAVGIGLPWIDVTDPQGLGFRLRIAAFVPMALAGAIAAGRLAAPVLAMFGAVLHARTRLDRHAQLALAGLAALLALRTPGARDEGWIATHPALVTSVLAARDQIPPGDTVIVPERHIAFMTAWYTRATVRLRPEQVPPERRWRLLPLALIGAGSPLDDALLAARARPRPPIGLHPRHPNGLVLVPEATWGWVLDQLPPALREHWTRWPTI